MQTICKIFGENMKKLRHFYSNVINPVTTCQVILDINTIIADHNKDFSPILSYEDLKKVLKLGFQRDLAVAKQPVPNH
jgi:hypothetical protein